MNNQHVLTKKQSRNFQESELNDENYGQLSANALSYKFNENLVVAFLATVRMNKRLHDKELKPSEVTDSKLKSLVQSPVRKNSSACLANSNRSDHRDNET